ncbi:MAG: M-like protein [uncultured Sulfurovum sp.]|uniref:M-like protein n=1 Tax=uncultured Sulfurovum sp. TaxID=269237 RepID=A0A6S6SX76_9BACT|nr:MAG: M-like protein [uncultured Sulfurovum sp.]
MNHGKMVSGIAALAIYLSLIFLVLYFYNIHQVKAKNYVEKNSDRVTVTLVNSEKTVFNKSDEVSTPKKPVSTFIPPVPLQAIPKKVPPKKVKPKKVIPRPKTLPKKVIPKPKNVIPKKIAPKKTTPKPKKNVPKKNVPKKIKPPKIKPSKKVLPVKKVVPIKKAPKKTAKDLFSSVKTTVPKKVPVKKIPKKPIKQTSSIKHNSSVTDRIRATHQNGRVSNANREKGIENAYIAKVERHMMNWNAVGARGQLVTVNLTIFNSGKFRYTSSGVSGAMQRSLKQYLNTLNRMGLGRHKKSSPYSIQVHFKVR